MFYVVVFEGYICTVPVCKLITTKEYTQMLILFNSGQCSFKFPLSNVEFSSIILQLTYFKFEKVLITYPLLKTGKLSFLNRTCLTVTLFTLKLSRD